MTIQHIVGVMVVAAVTVLVVRKQDTTNFKGLCGEQQRLLEDLPVSRQ